MKRSSKIGIVVVVIAVIIAGIGSFFINLPADESEQLQKAAVESEQYADLYIRSKESDYREFGALKSVEKVTCLRQYNDYQTISDAWHHRNGRTHSTCHADVEFEHGHIIIRLAMYRPTDASGQWHVHSSVEQP